LNGCNVGWLFESFSFDRFPIMRLFANRTVEN